MRAMCPPLFVAQKMGTLLGRSEILLRTLPPGEEPIMTRIAIIGAGIAGLSLAQALQPHAQVTVFEKARGVGGRMSARYADPYAFDHGAQFFTARDPAFRAFLAPLLDQGTVAPWQPVVAALAPGAARQSVAWTEPHYVACPNMNGLCKALASSLNVHTSTEIGPLTVRTSSGWELTDTAGNKLGVFDWVVSTAPHPQTARLFAESLIDGQALPERGLLPCYALMLGFNGQWSQPWQAATVTRSPIAWVALNSSKPARNQHPSSLVIHATHEWSAQQLESDPAEVEASLMQALQALDVDVGDVAYRSLHRWRYALADKSAPSGPYFHAAAGLAAAGDWTGAARVEDAWLQAMQLKAMLLASLTA